MAVGTLLLTAACAATTTEGVKTATCIDGTSTFELENSEAIYLGDISSDEFVDGGPQNDWFKVENKDGQIVHSHEEGGWSQGVNSGDDGKIITADDGFQYSENGHVYTVSFDNAPRQEDGAIAVVVETAC